MKKKAVVLVVVGVMLVIAAGVAVAQNGIPGSGWWTGEVIQNVGSSTATIVVTAYDKNGALTYTASQTITSGSSVTVIPSNFSSMPSGFIGSAVVSSDQPIKAVTNVTNIYNGTFGVPGGTAQALYQGTESASTALYFPLVKHNRFGNSTVYYIQNAGTTAATATAVFKMDTGGTYTATTPLIEPNKMVVINPIDASVPSTGGTGGRDNVGSLTVTSAQPLAGTVLEYTQGASTPVLKGTRGFSTADFAVKAYAPTVKNNRFGRFTGIQVQNVGASPIDITITYVGRGGSGSLCPAGSVYTDTATAVAPGASKTFNQLTGQTTLPSNCTASGTIVATGNFISAVNEDNTSTNAAKSGTTYSAMADPSKTTKMSVPQYKDRRFGATSGLMIVNAGSAPATNIVATFSCRGGATFTAISLPQSAPVGGAVQFYQPANSPSMFTVSNPFSAANVICGVTVTGDQPIVAVVNEGAYTGVAQIDDNNYEGFNLAP